jgi:hypothetical protein
MKAFSLYDALDGKPVTNGQGDTVVVTKLGVVNKNGLALISQRATDGAILAYHHTNGNSDAGSGPFKLFMAPTLRTVFINLYDETARYPLIGGKHGHWHTTEEAANKSAGSCSTRIGGKAHPIVIEE